MQLLHRKMSEELRVGGEVGSMGGWVDGHHDLPCDLLGLIVHGMG